MDAISFVLGVKSSQLRSSQLRELIYRDRIDDSEENTRNGVNGSSRRAAGNDSDPRKTSVTAVYMNDDQTETRFTRRYSYTRYIPPVLVTSTRGRLLIAALPHRHTATESFFISRFT